MEFEDGHPQHSLTPTCVFRPPLPWHSVLSYNPPPQPLLNHHHPLIVYFHPCSTASTTFNTGMLTSFTEPPLEDRYVIPLLPS